ncbi:MAG: DUF2975 domain-containing protein [Gammaproteobacteria bacterium]|nr:DUF2975 domain-containing protein [Gammaproteobacteria bacterium]
MANENLIRIQRISGKLTRLFMILTICTPMLILFYWLFFNQLSAGFKVGLPVDLNQLLPYSTLSLAFLISFLPGAVAIYGLITLQELFGLYEKAIVFSVNNVNCYRRLGHTLIYWVVAKFISIPLLSLVLTFNHPPGKRTLALGISSSEIATLITGIIVVVISWVMNEACKLNDEQAYTV